MATARSRTRRSVALAASIGLVLSSALVAGAGELGDRGAASPSSPPPAPRPAAVAPAPQQQAASASVATPRPAPAPATAGEPTVGPLVSGAASYVDGAFVWTDYAYDDRGPDTNDQPGGDATYPGDMAPNNVADLIQLQLRPSRSTTTITAVLETLTSTTRPVVAVAFDSDGRASTGAAALPGSWASAGPLGVDRLFVLRAGGGRTLVARNGAWVAGGTFPVTIDPARNTLVATVPFDAPSAGVLRAVAAVGYAGQDGRTWLDGGTPVHDLAFVTAESPTVPYLKSVADAITGFASGGNTLWQDYRQSAILGGKADPAAAVASIDLGRLRARTTSLAAPDRKGFHTFLYRSALRLGEGIQGSGNSALYAGPYQPYLVWVPERVRPGLPLVVYLHGSSQTHLSAVNTAHYDPSVRDPIAGLPEGTFDFDAVVAWPLGRGPQQSYVGPAEQDVLDVADDVLRRLALDRDRVMLAGLSMGGMGTFRLAQLHPDRWSVAYADVGIDEVGLLENLTNVPLRFQNGAADYLVNAALALETRVRVDAAGTVDYRSWMRFNNHHQSAINQAECIYRESFARPRVLDPARVRYTIDPSMFRVDPATGLRLRYDGAYWVDGMVPAGAGRGSIDVLSAAFGYEPVPGPTTRAVHENITAGRDFCGPNPDVRGRDSWDEQARVVERKARPAEPVARAAVRGLSAVTIAADRARIAVAGGRVELDTDAPLTVSLTGLDPGTVVRSRVGGRDVVVRANRAGVASMRLPAGRSVLSLR